MRSKKILSLFLLFILVGTAHGAVTTGIGINTSDSSLPPNESPVWNLVECGFVEGVADSCSLPCTDPEDDTLTITGPTGCSFQSPDVTLDSPNKEIDYGGVATEATVNSCVLACDDGINDPVDSAAFSIAITAQDGFAANSPGYTSIIPGGAGFGMDVADWPSSGYSFYEIDTLDTGTGTGTFRDAVEGSWSGCRIAYFTVSGIIEYPQGRVINQSNPCLWLPGQTAPSPGIVIEGATIKFRYDNVYMGHIVVAMQKSATDEICGSNGDTVGIIDPVDTHVYHNVLMMLACDENFSVNAGTSDNGSMYQSIAAWPLFEPFDPVSISRSFNVLVEQGVGWFLGRNLFANALQRSPLFDEVIGTIADNVVYNAGKQAIFIKEGTATHEVNIEANVVITGPDQVNNEGLRINTDKASEVKVFWDTSGAGMNRGLGGMPDPPNVNLYGSGSFSFEGSRLPDAYPTGYVLNGAGTNTSEEQAFVQDVMDCVGPRPNDRLPFIQTLIDQVLTYGTDGEHVHDSSELPFSWPPTVAENTDSHGDLPADPNAAGSPINAGVEWIMGFSTNLMTVGAGCN